MIKDVHLSLCDYKNGILHTGLEKVTEEKNSCTFYDAWNELRFPGAYVPEDITIELEDIRCEYEEIKKDIFEVGRDPTKSNRASQLAKYDKILEGLETKCNNLLHNWRSTLLSKESMLEDIFGSNY